MRRSARLLPIGALVLLVSVVAGSASVVRSAEPVPAGEADYFETHIRPVLVEHCYECHSARATVVQGGLRLDSAERLRAGGESGPVVVPGQPAESRLIAALRYESLEMPPDGKLPDAVIDHFTHWIERGAPDPRQDESVPAASSEQPANPRNHWALQRPRRPPVPELTAADATGTEIDRFVAQRLADAGLQPSPQASPRAQLRRLYYDLIGLPPTAEELAAFEADASDARYEAAVDWLLASPRFGERWARYWLDLARYADTKGYLFLEDRNYKHGYQYRDWVIASFNADRPYDEFVVAQLAADQAGDPQSIPAMGFLTLGRRFLNNRHDIINDRIDVVTRGLLGLTATCARCHDHKYDPISIQDYYALYGVFASSEEKPRDNAPPVLEDAAKPVEAVVFLRGDPSNRGPRVPRRFLACLVEAEEPPPFQYGSGRLEMARAIASGDNPLTARVWVNRVWAHLFGSGLVRTTSDFGTRGEPPTHPELLDWLACEFIEPASGGPAWSTKQLIRRIVLSNTYRQASDERPDCVAVDPENRLLWRASRRRLDLEALRDSLLLAAGRLDLALGGPSVELTKEPFATRRAVYGFIERQNLPAFFRTFDFANPNTHTPERPQTVAPQQALFLMNSPFVIEQATHLAKRSEHVGLVSSVTSNLSHNDALTTPRPVPVRDRERGFHADSSPRNRIFQLFQFALGREPTPQEVDEAIEFVNAESDTTSAITRWEQLAQVLLMSNELAFVD